MDSNVEKGLAETYERKDTSEHIPDKKDISATHLWNLITGGPLLGLFLVLGLEILGAVMTFPVFAFFCIETLKLSATSVGGLVAAFNLAQAIGSPIFGRISDAFGRRVILLFCFIWSAVCFGATSFANSFLYLLCVRTMAGLSGGSIPVAAAFIMDSASVVERPSVLGAKGAFLGLCFMAGPLLTVVLVGQEILDRRQIFLVAGALCFSAFLLGACILRESLPAEKRRPLFGRQSEGGGGIMAELQDNFECVTGGMVCAWFARFFYAFCVFTLYTTLPFVIKDNFGWAEEQFGMMLVVAGVLEGLLTLVVYPKVDELLGEHVACIVGFVVVCIGMLALPIPTVVCLFLGFGLFQIGQALAEPGVINLVGLHCPQERYMGFAQGTGNSLRAVASVFSPLVAGRLYDMNPFYAYGNAAAMVAVAALCALGAMHLGVAMVPEKEALLK